MVTKKCSLFGVACFVQFVSMIVIYEYDVYSSFSVSCICGFKKIFLAVMTCRWRYIMQMSGTLSTMVTIYNGTLLAPSVFFADYMTEK